MDSRIFLVGLLTLPFAANAQEFDYTFVEAGYVDSEIDAGPVDLDGDGFGVRGSLAINDTFHAFADYATQDLDFGLDASSFGVGAGRHWDIQDRLDFVGELSWINAEVDTPFGNADEDGFGVGAGLRFRSLNSVELQGMINYADLNDSDTSLSLAGRYYLSDTFAVGGGLAIDDNDTAWNIGVRAEFGDR